MPFWVPSSAYKNIITIKTTSIGLTITSNKCNESRENSRGAYLMVHYTARAIIRLKN